MPDLTKRLFGSPWFKPAIVLAVLVLLPTGLFLLRMAREGRSAAAGSTPLRPGVMLTPVFQPLPLGAVQPRGWLLEQLRIQANGLSGHLDEFWPDVKNSGWIGGKVLPENLVMCAVYLVFLRSVPFSNS